MFEHDRDGRWCLAGFAEQPDRDAAIGGYRMFNAIRMPRTERRSTTRSRGANRRRADIRGLVGGFVLPGREKGSSRNRGSTRQ